MVDKKKPLPLLQLLALLLLLSCLVLPLAAVPSTRSLALQNQEAAALGAVDQVMESRERRIVQEQFARIMDIESNDYPGSGANNRHDPKSPGRA